LRPCELTVPNLESWQPRPVARGEPLKVVVRVREPFDGGVLKVRCVAPLGEPPAKGKGPAPRDPPTGVDWKSPGLRLAEAVPRGEKLVLRLHPDVRPQGWTSGGFRLARVGTQAASAVDGQPGDASDYRAITLEGGGIGGGARPGARLLYRGADYRARTLAWW